MTEHVERTGRDAAAALHQVEISSRWLRVLGAVVAVVTLVAVVGFGVVSLGQQDDARGRAQRELVAIKTVLQGVQAATDPTSQFSRQQSARTQTEIDHLIGCLENHEDRLIAQFTGRPAPAVLAGCPTSAAGR